MKYRMLGNTGVYVSVVSLGTMTFGGTGTTLGDALGGLDLRAAESVVGQALDLGVNLIDTADVYSGGESEELLGTALGARRDDVILATKFSARTGTGPNQIGASRLHLMRALEDSLRRLKTDHIDLYQLHSIDPVTPIEETLAALDDAVRQGKVRYVGCSNLAAWHMMKAQAASERHGWTRFVASQSYYSLLGRDVEQEIVPMALDQNLSLLVWAPLAGGILSGKYGRSGADEPGARRAAADYPDFPPVDPHSAWDVVDVLRSVANRHGVSPAQVALAWVLSRPAVTSVVVGAKRPDQLADSVGAADLVLSAQYMADLEKVSDPGRSYPQWVWDFAGGGRVPE
ncbi:oxidoreductase [Mycolicibacterium murale]|uniref:Oxidoreductase n=1 Tax=Mycolicibacterium murale TaxID=182220 RepID=A0A7I9WFU1_9MYCO|nr:aldo/keto reductase [Mycolicibacterium murale]MCV7183028.1 aldo/keto reductase [Mycolicibacterium murale]GFG56583.1 oxidoreductase [Mycolicibacterium murale]